MKLLVVRREPSESTNSSHPRFCLAFPAHLQYYFLTISHHRLCMDLVQRLWMLLSEPDYATSDLYNSPRLGDAFSAVTAYAFVSSIGSLLSIILATQSFAFSILGFIGSFLVVYLTWALLAVIFHLASELLGGLGELPHAFSFVGLAAAPLLITSILSILLTITHYAVLPDDPDGIFPKMSLGISILGMAWGWPGILCYFGLKNAERLNEVKAMLVSLVVFFGFATFEVLNSSVW